MTPQPPDRGTDLRARLRGVIPRRRKVSPAVAIALAVGFALALTPVIRVDLWLAAADSLDVRQGEPSPITVRVPPFADGGAGGAIVIARGEIATPEASLAVATVRARTPHGLFGDLAYFAVLLVLSAIYTLHLSRSNRGRYVRTQAVLLGTIVALAVLIKAAMLLTSLSVLAVPVALLALVTAIAVDRDSGVATGVLASIVVGLLVPFDIGVTVILLIQATTASLLLPDRIRRKWKVAMWAGGASAVGGLLAYGIVHYLTRGTAPVDELGRVAASTWVAAAIGGVLAALLAVPGVAAMQVMCGEITDGALIQLEDLSHPLLRQIAEKSPGTWQHSLAMANMAEIAANAIGANGRLVRVGAYFHDLGKSLQPKYFIENVESGEQSPHDRLAPEVSCDAIFAHVTEGIQLARRHGLPERIIDFMHMHHGDGVLEYFWAKCQEQGNPKALSTEDFRYPGVPPQSRETAILAICDAVEAASRTLRRPDQKAIDSLVQRIVYGKLHLGQLDESGLSMADLRKVNDSLRETIKHAHHGRIEYPWQREAREAEAREAEATVAVRPVRPDESITQRILAEPRLDSLDAPRPPWAAGATPSARIERPATDATTAETVPVPAPPPLPPEPERTVSLRPSTAMLADSVDVAHAATARVPAQSVTDTGTLIGRPSAEPAPEPVPVPVPVPVPDSAAAAVSAAEPAAAAAAAPAAAAAAVAAAEPAAAPAAAAAAVAAAAAKPAAAAAEPAASSSAEIIAAPTPRWSGTFGAAAEAALEAVTGPLPRQTTKTPWGARIADRIDALLEAEAEAAAEPAPAEPAAEAPAPAAAKPPAEIVEDETAAPDAPLDPQTTARRTPPPPPGRRRSGPTTLEVDDDDLEATIELQPSARADGPISGPPPATRAPAHPYLDPTDDDDLAIPEGDEPEVTVIPSRPPPSSLPPRARK